MPENWVRVPIGDGEGYRSVQFQRTVLVVARTALSTEWLLDVALDVLADPRIQVVFTVEDEQPSVYHAGAQALLGSVSAATIPWSQALVTDFDLILSATRNGSLGKLRGPLLITPHGAGYGKLGSLLPDGAVPVSMPTPHSVQRFRNRPHTAVMLSHPEQATLFAAGPDVRLVVIGDPVWDQTPSQPAVADALPAGIPGDLRSADGSAHLDLGASLGTRCAARTADPTTARTSPR